MKKTDRQSDIKRSLIMLTVLILWSSSYIGIRYALHGYSPENLAFLRYLVASVIFIIIAIFRKIKIPTIYHLPGIAALGLVGFTLYNLLLNYGETTVDAGTSSFIINTVPFFSLLFAIIAKSENTVKRDWAGLFISFTGVGVIVFLKNDAFHTLNWHILLILIAAICQALYFSLQKRYLKEYTPIELTSYAIWIGTVFMFVFAHRPFANLKAAPPQQTLAIAYLGVFPGALAFLLMALVINKYRVSNISSYLFLIPFITILIAWLTIDEVISMSAVVGGVLIVAGILIKNQTFKFNK